MYIYYIYDMYISIYNLFTLYELYLFRFWISGWFCTLHTGDVELHIYMYTFCILQLRTEVLSR